MEDNRCVCEKEKYLKTMEKWMEEQRERNKVLIGDDFNAKTGRERGTRIRRL